MEEYLYFKTLLRGSATSLSICCGRFAEREKKQKKKQKNKINTDKMLFIFLKVQLLQENKGRERNWG